jgi:exodeoxyribonuclease VII small subunit
MDHVCVYSSAWALCYLEYHRSTCQDGETNMSKKKPKTPPNFEDSLEQLEAIIRKLEGGQLPLDDSLEQYEQGIRHLGLCYKTLARVEKKVELLSSFDTQGKPLTAPFDDRPSSDDGTNDIEGNSPSPKSPTIIKKGTAKIKGTAKTKETARNRRSSSSARTKQAKGNSKSNVDEESTLF